MWILLLKSACMRVTCNVSNENETERSTYAEWEREWFRDWIQLIDRIRVRPVCQCGRAKVQWTPTCCQEAARYVISSCLPVITCNITFQLYYYSDNIHMGQTSFLFFKAPKRSRLIFFSLRRRGTSKDTMMASDRRRSRGPRIPGL
jgi:hypothetical protein